MPLNPLLMGWPVPGNFTTNQGTINTNRIKNSLFFLYVCSARVMMIVQPGERNAFDQRWIEYSLLEK